MRFQNHLVPLIICVSVKFSVCGINDSLTWRCLTWLWRDLILPASGCLAAQCSGLHAHLISTIFLERMRGGHCQSDKHWNCFEGNVGETSERRGRAHIYGLFWVHRNSLELNCTKLKWPDDCLWVSESTIVLILKLTDLYQYHVSWQDLFQRTHPVHFLDSKAQGVGVDLSMPSLRTPSMAR